MDRSSIFLAVAVITGAAILIGQANWSAEAISTEVVTRKAGHDMSELESGATQLALTQHLHVDRPQLSSGITRDGPGGSKFITVSHSSARP
ncbi:MAG: hypothetical protein AAF218_03560 [Pseudomonadota bacterium]